jgi:membrane-associated phospholipid phosphatase
MELISKKLQIIASIAAFSLLMVLCYFFVDDHLASCTQDLRDAYYVPLRVLSILISPATQLVVWTSLFLWYLVIKRAEKTCAYLYPLIASLILTNALVRVVKVFFGRSRPDIFLTDGIYHLKMISFQRIFSSLPSGHAATLAAIMGFLAAKYPKHSLLFITLSVTLSLCRVFIGAHYLSDVLVGNFLGLYVSWILYYQETLSEPAYLMYTKAQAFLKGRKLHN